MFICACSDKGKIRDINQDACYHLEDDLIPIFIVADGMGGHKAGEVASNLAISTIIKHYEKNKEEMLNEEMFIPKFMNESIESANEILYKKSLEDEEFNGMGTTITMAIIFKDELYVGHVGDSRAYVLKNDELIQITQDHSFVGELLRTGSITKEEAFNHPKKNVINRAVGTDKTVKVDVVTHEIEEDDMILLCTDGLIDMVSEVRIVDIIKNTKHSADVCNILANTANELGGIDNITIMIMNNKQE